MNTNNSFPGNAPLSEKILYVLSLLKKATVDEIAMEIMELQGTSSEEGVAELTITTAEGLKHLHTEGLVKMVTESDKQTRYFLT